VNFATIMIHDYRMCVLNAGERKGLGMKRKTHVTFFSVLSFNHQETKNK